MNDVTIDYLFRIGSNRFIRVDVQKVGPPIILAGLLHIPNDLPMGSNADVDQQSSNESQHKGIH